MLDMRRGGPHLVTGRIDRPGVRLKQSGEWDDRLLCDRHEALVGRGDDYGVDFCRRWMDRAGPRFGGKALELPNERPGLLLHFAYAVIWRFSRSEFDAGGPKLGPFEEEMRNALINSGPYGLDLMLGMSPLVIGRSPANVAVSPHRMRIAERNAVEFTISGLDFYLITDQRGFPPILKPFLANDNDPVIVGVLDPMRLQDIPKLQPILTNMRNRRKAD